MKQAQAAAISESVHFVRGVFIDRPVNGNMTAYRLQSGTSCIGYQSDNGSSSIRVFSCTTACTIYHPALCPACVGRSLLTIVADIYDQLHAVTRRHSHKTRSSADADNRLDAFSGQSRSTNMVPFHM